MNLDARYAGYSTQKLKEILLNAKVTDVKFDYAEVDGGLVVYLDNGWILVANNWGEAKK